MSNSREERAAKIRQLLAEEGDPISENTRGFNKGRYESVGQLEDYEALKERARRIKEDAIERLPELVQEVTKAVEGNGGHVYIADDADDANQYVREVVTANEGETVVKSKSMTTEEIELNEALDLNGVEVWETDLGEFVLQIANESPSHIVAPAIHKSREDIADLFNYHFEPDTSLSTAEELTQFASEYLGERIQEAEVGITGANFIAADSGTLALVTSEGNARKCAISTDTHIAIAGIEKLVPSVSDFQPFIELIGRSGTGQDITSYLSLFKPPVESPPIDFDTDDQSDNGGTDFDDREFHLVLLDNGRREMRDDEVLRETLYCIRCSACLNSCANFQSVGGHAFGGDTYSGGIGTGWEAGINGEESAAEFNDLCTGCSRCVNQCPVKIDIPWLNTAIRDRINRGADPSRFDAVYSGLVPDEEPGGLSLRKRFFGNFGTLATIGSATAPVSNILAETVTSRLFLERFLGIDRRRDLPTFQRRTLEKWFHTRDIDEVNFSSDEVVVYPDLYTNHVNVSRGKATVRALEALGVEVILPACVESGRAPLSQGMIATARSQAERVQDELAPHIDAGRDIVVIEPSDLAMFRREYEKLLPTDQYEGLSNNSYEVMEYLYGLLENGADPGVLEGGDNRVAYHAHCQQRTLGLEPYTTSVLEVVGFDVETSDVECCGMAGSFGYKTEYYDLSMDVGETLATQFEGYVENNLEIVASGTSCLDQIQSLLDSEPRHPIELIAPSPKPASETSAGLGSSFYPHF